jgi:hypothetical protein
MRIALVLGALAVAVALFLLLRPEGDDDEAATTSAPATTTETESETTTAATTASGLTTTTALPGPVRVVFRDGRVRGGLQTFSFEQGDRIRLIVRADVADHVHVHGFDLITDVAPGRPAKFTFRADLTGSFEVELEDRGVPLVELRVRP